MLAKGGFGSAPTPAAEGFLTSNTDGREGRPKASTVPTAHFLRSGTTRRRVSPNLETEPSPVFPSGLRLFVDSTSTCLWRDGDLCHTLQLPVFETPPVVDDSDRFMTDFSFPLSLSVSLRSEPGGVRQMRYGMSLVCLLILMCGELSFLLLLLLPLPSPEPRGGAICQLRGWQKTRREREREDMARRRASQHSRLPPARVASL
ncbi:hypothetical protein LX32DRAFT_133901 [Colletotrichum zoysiae]|uniref:Uncharacterized protein n=1 Tax=Colletotrichum zoysiae TaxID=1216348 RepID=A0AAD9LZ46_9PEZI|nr:hypothetical protein LX32DRAFT_133901 [Colletotrichum zoysiae]